MLIHLQIGEWTLLPWWTFNLKYYPHLWSAFMFPHSVYHNNSMIGEKTILCDSKTHSIILTTSFYSLFKEKTHNIIDTTRSLYISVRYILCRKIHLCRSTDVLCKWEYGHCVLLSFKTVLDIIKYETETIPN